VYLTSRDNSVNITTGYGLDDWNSILSRSTNFFRNVQTGSGAHSTSCPVGTGGGSPRAKWLEREGDHYLHLTPRSSIRELYISIPPYVFTAWCLIKYRDKFCFVFKLIVSKSSDWLVVSKKFESMWSESGVLLSRYSPGWTEEHHENLQLE
jgi:hypothetical protein